MLARLLLFLLPVMLLAGCAYPDAAIVDQREIRQTTVAYLKDLSDGDSRDAYTLLGPTLRSRCSESTFSSMVGLAFTSNHTPGQQKPEAKIEDLQIDIDAKTARAKLVLSEKGSDDTLSYEYVKDGADWYVLPPDLSC